MTANELVDKLEKPMVDNPDCPNFSRTRKFMEQVVAMLRQQQAEIEALRNNGYKTQYELLRIECMEQKAEIESYKNPIMQAIAMAFDPLTDDEIDMLVHEYNLLDDHPHEFVRACIRKAQR